jgi:hypothetical protein
VIDTADDAVPEKPIVRDPAAVLTLAGRSLAFLRARETSDPGAGSPPTPPIR